MADHFSLAGITARGLVVLALAAFAWPAMSFSFAMAGYSASPALAARLAPGNAFVQASLARSFVQIDSSRAEVAARRALERDPTRASAAGTLGLALAQRGEMQRGLALLDFSERISRRDLQVHLWGIELAAERGDIRGALHHYDLALRVGSTTPNLLFPVLASAISDPLIREPLARMLASDPSWAPSFFEYLAPNAPDAVPAGRLIDAIHRLGGDVARAPLNGVIRRLVDANEVDLAWTLYANSNAGSKRTGIRNGSFEALVEAPSVLDWQFGNLPDAWAAIAPGERGNALEISAQPGSGGVVAHQRLLLQPGTYQLSFRARSGEGTSVGGSAFRLRCLPSGRELVEVPLAAAENGNSFRSFTVTSGCISQILEINLYSGATDMALGGTIDDIAISPQT